MYKEGFLARSADHTLMWDSHFFAHIRGFYGEHPRHSLPLALVFWLHFDFEPLLSGSSSPRLSLAQSLPFPLIIRQEGDEDASRQHPRPEAEAEEMALSSPDLVHKHERLEAKQPAHGVSPRKIIVVAAGPSSEQQQPSESAPRLPSIAVTSPRGPSPLKIAVIPSADIEEEGEEGTDYSDVTSRSNTSADTKHASRTDNHNQVASFGRAGGASAADGVIQETDSSDVTPPSQPSGSLSNQQRKRRSLPDVPSGRRSKEPGGGDVSSATGDISSLSSDITSISDLTIASSQSAAAHANMPRSTAGERTLDADQSAFYQLSEDTHASGLSLQTPHTAQRGQVAKTLLLRSRVRCFPRNDSPQIRSTSNLHPFDFLGCAIPR
jgi:hypothetical protein